MYNVIININNCEQKRAIAVRLIIAQRKTAIKRVGPIITGAVRADKETLLYMAHSVFRPLLLLTFPVVDSRLMVLLAENNIFDDFARECLMSRIHL